MLMTLLILLISVVVLERVLRRPHAPPPPDTYLKERERLFEAVALLEKAVPAKMAALDEDGVTAETPSELAPALNQLGQTLEQFGRGAVPEAAPERQPSAEDSG